jgi:HAD superfamily hydrolase (TIGR01509 family)
VTYRYIEEKYGIPAGDFKAEAEKGMPRAQTGETPEESWMNETYRHFGKLPCDAWEVWGSTFEAARYNADAVALIEKLRKRGYRVAALSNLESSRASWLRRHDIDSLFDVIVFSCEVGMRKPDLKPGSNIDLAVYRLTLHHLGLRPEECVFIDDNNNCVAAAEQAGMKGIQFRNVKQLE